MHWLVIILIIFVAMAAIVLLNLPAILRTMGLHRHYTIPDFDLRGKRAVVICTNHATGPDR